MTDLPACPNCASVFTYEDGILFVCPECAHEWSHSDDTSEESSPTIVDSVGNTLADGDTVSVIKDLKVRDPPASLK